MEQEKSKVQRRSNSFVPILKKASTQELAFIFNMAARIISSNPRLVICYTKRATEFILTPQEISELRIAYGNWLAAYIKGLTNDRPSIPNMSLKTGIPEAIIHRAIKEAKPSQAYILTYDLLKNWGYIDEY